MSDPILFGYRGAPSSVAFLSNFYRCRFTLWGHDWRHSEGPYQWAKNRHAPGHLTRCLASNPWSAKRSGRIISLHVASWNEEREPVMLEVLQAKFAPGTLLSKFLLQTGEQPLHESRSDPYWGGGPEFPEGRDRLGEMLMARRNELRRAI